MEKKRILITGGTGLLGKALIATAPVDAIIAVTYMNDMISNLPASIESKKINLEFPDDLFRFVKEFKPDVLFHTAGIGSVDDAEKNQTHAKKINYDTLAPLVECLNKLHSTLVFISSNAVYDGESPPYNEESEQRAVNYYGQLKILSEKYVRENSSQYIIIRPILIYGWPQEGRRDNPFSWIVKKLSNNEPMKLVNDTVTMPLLDRDCANVCWKSLSFPGQSFNVAGSEKTTFYDFGKVIAEEFGFNSDLLSPVGSDAFPTIAKRPRDTSYDISKIRTLLEFHPVGIREGARYLKETRSS
ncbi:MAG: SDR family oxidoreductase [Leptospiraceae bacterium]|nr:SDR family oxidoreductase [Leptospiraceae bacterium]